MKKPKKPSRSKLVAKLDRLFSLYIRLNYSDDEWFCKCFTCWKKMKRNDKDCSCWHRIKRDVQFLRRNKNNARPQCMRRCNSKLAGNGEQLIFRRNLIQDVWIKEVESMEDQYIEYRKDITKFKVYDFQIEEMIEEYKQLVKDLAEKKNIEIKI